MAGGLSTRRNPVRREQRVKCGCTPWKKPGRNSQLRMGGGGGTVRWGPGRSLSLESRSPSPYDVPRGPQDLAPRPLRSDFLPLPHPLQPPTPGLCPASQTYQAGSQAGLCPGCSLCLGRRPPRPKHGSGPLVSLALCLTSSSALTSIW